VRISLWSDRWEGRLHYQPGRPGRVRGGWRVDSGGRLPDVASSSPTATSTLYTPLHRRLDHGFPGPNPHEYGAADLWGPTFEMPALCGMFSAATCAAKRAEHGATTLSELCWVVPYRCRGTRSFLTTSGLCALCLAPWIRSMRRGTLLIGAGYAQDPIRRSVAGYTRDKGRTVTLYDKIGQHAAGALSTIHLCTPRCSRVEDR
jgi:hypothetical protein